MSLNPHSMTLLLRMTQRNNDRRRVRHEVRPKCKMLTSADRSTYLCPAAVARPIGPTRPPDTRPHPYRIAVQDPNPHSQYCQLGCT